MTAAFVAVVIPLAILLAIALIVVIVLVVYIIRTRRPGLLLSLLCRIVFNFRLYLHLRDDVN